ncbi:MAG: hypothetical protein HY879_07045 [Deltaproteobacteria bacterium]|nr:hypothetical protein [Deltaproteobacteria bacterium]
MADLLLSSLIMIRIEEHFNKTETVELRVEGRLDRESLPALRQVCARHLEAGKKVRLHLGGLNHTGQDGLDFLRSIRDRVLFLELNEYFKMAIYDTDQPVNPKPFVLETDDEDGSSTRKG